MTEVMEARREYDDARIEARATVARFRARLGRKIVEARAGGESQTDVMKNMKRSREQVRAFEAAYHAWLRDNNGEQP